MSWITPREAIPLGSDGWDTAGPSFPEHIPDLAVMLLHPHQAEIEITGQVADHVVALWVGDLDLDDVAVRSRRESRVDERLTHPVLLGPPADDLDEQDPGGLGEVRRGRGPQHSAGVEDHDVVADPLELASREGVTTSKPVHSGAASRRSTTTRRRKLSLPDPRGAVLASRWLRDGRTPGWAHKHTPIGWARVLAEPARYGWNAEDLNAIITDWATDTGQVPEPTTPVAFLRWLLQRHDLAFSPTLLDHARRDQERLAAQKRREAAAQELVRSAEARAMARADLHGPVRRLAGEVLDQASRAAAERKAAAIRAEHAARAAAVARARGRR